MYRDLSAQLAAKEMELTEARQTIAALEERLAATESELQQRISLLESALKDVNDSSGNRDAVLKNALTQRDEMSDARYRAEAELAVLRASLRETQSREKFGTFRSVLDGVEKWLRK